MNYIDACSSVSSEKKLRLVYEKFANNLLKSKILTDILAHSKFEFDNIMINES